MSDRYLTPIIAIGLAFLIWLYFRSRDQEVLDGQVPVELEVASAQEPEYQFEPKVVDPLKVSFTGPPSRIREVRSQLHQGALSLKRVVRVPEDHRNDATYEETLRFDPADVQVPPGVRVVIAENQRPIRVRWRKLMEKQLPVIPTFDAKTRDRVEHWVCEPPTILVRGPRAVLEPATALHTEICVVADQPANVDGSPARTSQQAELIQELGNPKQPIRVSQEVVTVRLTLKPSQKDFDLVDVPVHFLCPANFPYRPQFTTTRPAVVTLKVHGPASDQRPQVTAFVDLTVRKFGVGLHADEPIQVQLPKDYQLVGEPPKLSSFKLAPPEAATTAIAPP